MSRRAMRKNLRQSIFRSLGRFIAIVMIIALGSCLFIGLLATRTDMVLTGEVFTANTRMFDFRMISTYGWEEEQVRQVEALEGVATAEGVFYQDLIASRNGEDSVFRFYNIPRQINQVLLRGGRMPEKPWECLADGYFSDASILGTQVTLSQDNDQDALENMTYNTYTVVGYVASPLYMDPNRGTTTVGTGSIKGYYYIPEEGFQADYYTQIDLTLKQTHPIYSAAYNDLLDSMTDELEAQAERLGEERFESIRLEAEEEYQEGYQEYLDGLQEYNDGVAEFEQELADARKELEDAEITIDRTNYTLNRGAEKLEEAKGMLWSNEQQLNAAEAELKQQEAATREGLPQLEEGIRQLEDAQAAILQGMSPVTPGTSGMAILYLESQIALLPEDSAQRKELEGQLAGLRYALDQYNSVTGQLSGYRSQRDAAVQALNHDIPAAYKAIADGRNQIREGWKEIEEQSLDLHAARKELEKAREDLAQGWIDYEEGKLEGEQELSDAWEELEEGRLELLDARKEIDELEAVEVYLLDRNTNVGYNTLDSSSNILAGVSRILPLFFLLVAALVCTTTMTRMVEEERTQIGTLKALGYSNGAIITKYMFYAGTASVLGSILGALVGNVVIPKILWIAFGAMLYLQPNIELTVNWPLCLTVGAVCTGSMLLVTWYCCRRTLREEPAELIRPKAPDAGRQLLFEKLPFWNHISFLNKVTIRNIFRYRQRLAMMLVGIGGCTALLVTAFGLKNSLVGVVDYQYQNITLQHLEVNLDGHQQEAARNAFVAELSDRTEDVLFLHQSNVTLDTGSAVSELTMVCAGEDLTRFMKLSRAGETVPMPEKDQVVLSIGMSQNLGLREGDTVMLRDADMRIMTLTVSGFFENHISNYAIVSPETYLSQLGTSAEVQMAYVRAGAGEDHYLLAAAISGMDNVMNVMVSADFASMITDLMEALDMLVWVIVICAGLLGATVVYNLTNINITERIREIATIKVLGFNAGETASYVFKENVTLTIVGGLLGLGLGKLLLIFVLNQIKVDLIWFRCIILPNSYILALVLTLVCAMLVNFVFYFKLDKINMAEALKSVE